MKKLFAIAIAASMFGGLYGFSVGLGVAYDQLTIDSLYGEAHPVIKADLMCKPLPILGFRFGIIDVALESDDYGGMKYTIATGLDATVLFYIPMAGMVMPYIPFYFKYENLGGPEGADDVTNMYLFAGLGAEMGFGGFMGYIEGQYKLIDMSALPDDAESMNHMRIQGGVRIPIGL